MTEWIQDACTVIGATGGLMTALAAVLPKRWGVTRFFARWGADVKNVCGNRRN